LVNKLENQSQRSATAPAKATPGQKYLVVRGDTLSALALRAIKTASAWPAIAVKNPTLVGQPDGKIRAGTWIEIPTIEEFEAYLAQAKSNKQAEGAGWKNKGAATAGKASKGDAASEAEVPEERGVVAAVATALGAAVESVETMWTKPAETLRSLSEVSRSFDDKVDELKEEYGDNWATYAVAGAAKAGFSLALFPAQLVAGIRNAGELTMHDPATQQKLLNGAKAIADDPVGVAKRVGGTIAEAASGAVEAWENAETKQKFEYGAEAAVYVGPGLYAVAKKGLAVLGEAAVGKTEKSITGVLVEGGPGVGQKLVNGATARAPAAALNAPPELLKLTGPEGSVATVVNSTTTLPTTTLPVAAIPAADKARVAQTTALEAARAKRLQDIESRLQPIVDSKARRFDATAAEAPFQASEDLLNLASQKRLGIVKFTHPEVGVELETTGYFYKYHAPASEDFAVSLKKGQNAATAIEHPVEIRNSKYPGTDVRVDTAGALEAQFHGNPLYSVGVREVADIAESTGRRVSFKGDALFGQRTAYMGSDRVLTLTIKLGQYETRETALKAATDAASWSKHDVLLAIDDQKPFFVKPSRHLELPADPALTGGPSAVLDASWELAKDTGRNVDLPPLQKASGASGRTYVQPDSTVVRAYDWDPLSARGAGRNPSWETVVGDGLTTAKQLLNDVEVLDPKLNALGYRLVAHSNQELSLHVPSAKLSDEASGLIAEIVRAHPGGNPKLNLIAPKHTGVTSAVDASGKQVSTTSVATSFTPTAERLMHVEAALTPGKFDVYSYAARAEENVAETAQVLHGLALKNQLGQPANLPAKVNGALARIKFSHPELAGMDLETNGLHFTYQASAREAFEVSLANAERASALMNQRVLIQSPRNYRANIMVEPKAELEAVIGGSAIDRVGLEQTADFAQATGRRVYLKESELFEGRPVYVEPDRVLTLPYALGERDSVGGALSLGVNAAKASDREVLLSIEGSTPFMVQPDGHLRWPKAVAGDLGPESADRAFSLARDTQLNVDLPAFRDGRSMSGRAFVRQDNTVRMDYLWDTASPRGVGINPSWRKIVEESTSTAKQVGRNVEVVDPILNAAGHKLVAQPNGELWLYFATKEPNDDVYRYITELRTAADEVSAGAQASKLSVLVGPPLG
jgi:hypothetical protein